MQPRSAFFYTGAVMDSPTNYTRPAELGSAVAAMQRACYGPQASGVACQVLSESVGRLSAQNSVLASSVAAASRATSLAATQKLPSQPNAATVAAALAALGQQPSTLARVC